MSAPAVSYLIDERRVSVDTSKKLGEGTFGVVYLATLNGVLNVVAKVQGLLFIGAYQASAWNLELNFALSFRKYHKRAWTKSVPAMLENGRPEAAAGVAIRRGDVSVSPKQGEACGEL